tara:strand:+ start:265 stop:1062 length:798 start_codon:yes stop_codon:yes gene_type:complete
MSVQAISWALGVKTGSASLKAVLLVLSNYADEQGRCWPAQATIAREAELSLRTVTTNMGKLEALGLIERGERKRENGSRTSDMITCKMASDPLRKICVPPTQRLRTPPEPVAYPEPLLEPPLDKTDTNVSVYTSNKPEYGADMIDDAVSDYNAICGDVGLAKCQRITKPRRAKIAARIKTDGLMGWAEACKIVAGSAFCRGEGGTGWRADIDFIASESGFTKIMEGKYDDREITNAPSAVTQSRRNALREIISEGAHVSREPDPF